MKDFNDIIKDKLYNYQVTPPEELFDAVRKHYPKRTLFEKIKYSKFYIISSLLILLITGGVIIYNIYSAYESPANAFVMDNSAHISKNDNSASEILTNESLYSGYNTEKELLNISAGTTAIHSPNTDNSNFRSIEILAANVFDVVDTVVCGEAYENKHIDNINNLVLPENITIVRNNNNLSFVSSKPGKYFIKYYEEQSNKILIDSMYVEYDNVELPDIAVSSEILCYNEDLYVTVRGNAYSNWKWDMDNGKIQSVDKNKYKISGLHSGINKLAWSFKIGECTLKQERDIKVKDKFEYSVNIKPNYCAGINATVTINPKNYNPKYYILDNSQINKTGVFESLNSGMHILQVNYSEGCNMYDTLFIFDSLNINPYFTSEKDLINNNKYNFRNYTKIDDIGYERNGNVEFIWKVNNTEFSVMDNPSYEFKESGMYTIELIAMLNNNCIGSYSENIVIADLELKIPNVFTPNGDDIGDKFEISYEEEFVSYHIIITSRRGEKVFESEDIYTSWDGKIFGNNDAPDGYYSYIITGRDKRGHLIEQTGFVQLIRR